MIKNDWNILKWNRKYEARTQLFWVIQHNFLMLLLWCAILLKEMLSYGKGKKCTMCYRCISHCPKMAITLIGDEVKEQCQFEKYS